MSAAASPPAIPSPVRRLGPELTPDGASVADGSLLACLPGAAVLTFDEDLRLLSARGHGVADLGGTPAGLEGRLLVDAFGPDTSAVLAPAYRAALRGESSSLDVLHEGRLVEHRVGPLQVQGRVVGGIALTQDVTAVRGAVGALQESEQRLRMFFDHAPIGKAIVELDGRWREVNPAVCALTGYSREELLGMTFQDITHPDDLDLDLGSLHRLLAGEIPSYRIEKRYITATGGVVWVMLSVVLVRDDDGEPLCFISQIQDIGERKRQETALRDLTAMLAHDLRAPTTVITGFLDLVMRSWETQSDDQRKELLRRVSAAGKSMQMLLENSLMASSLDDRGFHASPTHVDVRALAEEVLGVVPQDAVTVDLAGLAPCLAWADRSHLVHVLTNLLTNAVKYGGSRITLTAEEVEGEVRLTVADDGTGVPSDFVPQLFDRFSRSEAARHGAQRGSGLGLYIVRDLLALNQASIAYETAPGGGASFVVRLPASRGACA